MKKIILIGNSGSGKTTLCQYINHLDIEYKKTQTIEVINGVIDTPGEYLESTGMRRALLVGSTDAELVFFIQDASNCNKYNYSPGIATMFSAPVAGIVTKTDIASKEEISNAKELLALAGADPIFCVSSITEIGMDEFINYCK